MILSDGNVVQLNHFSKPVCHLIYFSEHTVSNREREKSIIKKKTTKLKVKQNMCTLVYDTG